MAPKIGRNQACPCGSGKKFKRCCYGAQEAVGTANTMHIKVPVARERIHGGVIHHEQRTAYFITKDVLSNTLRRDLPAIESSFDQLCEAELIRFNELISRSYFAMVHVFPTACKADRQLRLMFVLAQNALTTLVAALDCTRRGFRLQPGSLVRSAVETLCVICHLVQQPNDAEKVENGTLDSPKTVKSAKAVFPPMGEFYGALSNSFVHTGHLHCELNPTVPYKEGDDALNTNLSQLKLSFWLAYVVIELAFLPWIDNARYWKEHGPSQYRFDPNDSEREWLAEFTNLLADKEDSTVNGA